MTVSSSTQIPRTSDPIVFQRQCKVLFEELLNDPNVKEFGSSGDKQYGIDILGRRRVAGPQHWVGIQCKLTIKTKKLDKKIVRIEAAQALSIQPALKEFIIVTTSDEVAALDTEAAIFTDEQASLGRDFTVQVWGWQTLETHILQYPKALKAFLPDAFPHMTQILEGQDKLIETVSVLAAGQGTILKAVSQINSSNTVVVAAAAIWDDSKVDSLLDRQIDQYRNMLSAGLPRTALGLLENLWIALPEKADGRIRFRIKGNIAACVLRLGNEKKAGELYLEACSYDPNNTKAVPLIVLAHILLGEPQIAQKLGLAALGGASDQIALTTNLLLATKFLPVSDDPFSIVSEAVKNAPSVAIAKINYLRTHHESGDWKTLARVAQSQHPSDEILIRFAAEAAIEEACAWERETGRQPLKSELRERVLAAASALKGQWNRSLDSEDFWDDNVISLGVNLANGYRVLNQGDEAKSVVAGALQHIPEHPLFTELLMVVALEEGDFKTAAAVAKKLPLSRNSVMGRLQIYANESNWQEIIALGEDEAISKLIMDDRAFFDTIQSLAKFKLGLLAEPREVADELMQTYPAEPILPIIFHEIAKEQLDEKWAEELFGSALAQRDRLNAAHRSMLARIAERESKPDKVIDLLNGYIDLYQDTSDVRLLARSFVNAPVRQSSADFIAAISPELLNKPFYSRVVGSIYFNLGNLGEAERAFRRALLADSDDAATHIGLVNTLLRSDRRDAAKEHLTFVKTDKLKGDPAYKMGLAQLLVAFGQAERGLEFGYATALTNRDDVKTVQLYIGLLLPNPKEAPIPELGPDIQIDNWLLADDDEGRKLSIVIEKGPDRPSISHYGPEHPLAKLFLGKKKGSTVSTVPKIGTPQKWTVREYKHKYLALLHEFMETLNSRFPEAEGFYQFQLQGSDLSPMLEEVKKFSERDDEALKFYYRDNFPLSVAARMMGKGSVEFAGNLRRRGQTIRNSLGTFAERDEAIANIQKYREVGVVLDSYTAWIVHSLEVIQLLKTLFKRVVLPQTGLDELMRWRERFEHIDGEPLMTIGYANGEFFREELSAEKLVETVKHINDGIIHLRQELEVVAVAPPNTLSSIESGLIDVGPRGFLDPIHIGVRDGLLLISEDLHYRNAARQLRDLTSAWLQPFLMIAQHEKLIDQNLYARAICNLAMQGHDPISFTAIDLINIAQQEQSDDMERFMAVAAFIGTAIADYDSHLSVSTGFIFSIWKTKLPNLRKAKSTGIMLERLAEMGSRKDHTSALFNALLESSGSQPAFQEYLFRWLKGHFLVG